MYLHVLDMDGYVVNPILEHRVYLFIYHVYNLNSYTLLLLLLVDGERIKIDLLLLSTSICITIIRVGYIIFINQEERNSVAELNDLRLSAHYRKRFTEKISHCTMAMVYTVH